MKRKLVLVSLLLLGVLRAPRGDTAVDVVIGSGGIGAVNGVAYPANPAVDTVPTVTATNTVNYKAIPDCDDSIGQHLNYDTATHTWICGNSTRTVPASKNHTDLATIDVDSNIYNEVRIDELSQTTNLAAPTGSPFDGQRLRYSITSTVSRLLTYTTTSGGFAAEAGQNFPTKTIAGYYLILEFRWSGKSSHWALSDVSWQLPKVTAFDLTASGSSVTINTNTTELATIALGASAQANNTTTLSTVATPYDGQVLRVRFTTTGPAPAKPLIWDSAITNNQGLPIPTTTTGGGKEDLFGLSYNPSVPAWVMTASSQTNQYATLKACIIALGDQVAGALLTNADLGPRFRQCPALGATGTVKEVGVYADAGTPSLIPHRRTGTTTALDLVSSAIPVGANGTYNCARIAGDTLSQNGATTCNTNLINASYSGEVSFGLSAGGVAGGVAKEITVVIFYVPGG